MNSAAISQSSSGREPPGSSQAKAAIRMKGMTPSVLADELGLSRSSISQVIRGSGTSERVKARIAEVTGLSVTTLWPPKSVLVLRRASPAKKSLESERRDQARRERERREQERRDGERRAGAGA